MNLSEFKAWFEGFTEDMEERPSAKQWARVKEKISQIKDAPPVTQHVFHDYYYRPWRRWYEGPIWQGNIAYSTGMKSLAMAQSHAQQIVADQIEQHGASVMCAAESFDSGTAFRELGRAEARSITKA
jgi:hypothetical protein